MKCRWCGDDIACAESNRDEGPHKDACCSCYEYILEAKVAQLTLEEVG
jgi:hypothetical protein